MVEIAATTVLIILVLIIIAMGCIAASLYWKRSVPQASAPPSPHLATRTSPVSSAQPSYATSSDVLKGTATSQFHTTELEAPVRGAGTTAFGTPTGQTEETSRASSDHSALQRRTLEFARRSDNALGNLRLPSKRFVVLDLETTGLSPNAGARIIEVSAKEFIDGHATREFLTFVNPNTRVPSFITSLTGITTEMIERAPKSAEVMSELMDFIGGAPIVGHNISFDIGFLRAETYSVTTFNIPTSLCTMRLSRRAFPSLSSYRLGSVVESLGISIPQNLHRAASDT